jgi:hypothetical protein
LTPKQKLNIDRLKSIITRIQMNGDNNTPEGIQNMTDEIKSIREKIAEFENGYRSGKNNMSNGIHPIDEEIKKVLDKYPRYKGGKTRKRRKTHNYLYRVRVNSRSTKNRRNNKK